MKRSLIKMADITLTPEQYAKLPYRTSTVTKGKTYGEIIGLLEDHGIKNYRWTKLDGIDILEFPVIFKYRDMDRNFVVKLTVPRLHADISRGKGYHKTTSHEYLEKESWRIFWWFLKSKLEAVEFGISDEFREFMPNIAHALPSGGETNLADLILEKSDRLDRLSQLEDKRGPRIIEAEIVDHTDEVAA